MQELCPTSTLLALYPVPVPHAAHVVATGATEYCMAGQLEHVLSAVTLQAAALFFVPAGQTVQGVQALAPAADQLLVATQALHTVFDVAVQVALRYVPAEHVDEAQALQGA